MAEAKTETIVETTHETYDVQEVARMAGVTAHGVRKAMKEGRLRRCNPVYEKPRFKKEEVEKYINAVEGGSRRAGGVSEEIELAKADALTNLVSQAQGHTRDAFEVTLRMVDCMRRDHDQTLEDKRKEIDSLLKRITKLEESIDEYHVAIEVLRKAEYDRELAKAEGDKIREQGRAVVEVGKLVAPALLARLFGGEELNQGAFQKLVESFTDAQRDQIFQGLGAILTPDQQMTMGILLSGWEAKASKKKEPAPANGAGSVPA